jgi:hypothetical protein
MKPSPVLWQDLEPLSLGGLAESLVKADEVLTGGPSIDPEERCRELESVCRAERVQEEHAGRRISDLVARLNLDPVSGQARHGLSGLVLVGTRQDSVASQPRKSGITFDRRDPPNDDSSVILDDVSRKSSP